MGAASACELAGCCGALFQEICDAQLRCYRDCAYYGVAAELVSMQRLVNLWLKAWENASQNKDQRTLLSVQAKQWSDRAMDFSGLLK